MLTCPAQTAPTVLARRARCAGPYVCKASQGQTFAARSLVAGNAADLVFLRQGYQWSVMEGVAQAAERILSRRHGRYLAPSGSQIVVSSSRTGTSCQKTGTGAIRSHPLSRRP